MASPQIPFISAPFKRTEDIDWVHPLKRYIAQVYQDDPEKYNEETYTLNRLRQDTRGAGKDITGRDLLYRYFGQLELLDLRFPVDEKHVKVLFTWYDAFNGRSTSQYSLAYEKASIVFNTAATLSAIAAAQNRAEADGRKRAFNFFQASAGMFQYINDNFLHAPSQDLSRETVKMLTELMLAQAQECFLENSVREKKKGGLIAKLASHLVWVYGNLVDDIQDATSRGVGVEKSWLLICQIKQKYYQALSQQHKAAACEAENKYGEQVARLSVAETAAKDVSKIVSNLLSQVHHANGTVPADGAPVLQELCKSMAASCGEKRTIATRDNDMIYHDHVPQESILTPIDRLKAVKPIPISELYGQNETSKLIGADIFARLIPLSVHESSSMYSEEKAKLVRAESERCDLAKAEMNASLDYMRLPGSLEKFRKHGDKEPKGNGLSMDEFLTVPKQLRDWADQVAAEEKKTSVRELIETLNGLQCRARRLLDDVSLNLDQEMRGCESMRVKYGDKWTQEPSGALTNEFRHDVRNHRETLDAGTQSDGQILRQYDIISNDIAALRQGGNSPELEKAFTESMSSLFQTDNGSSGNRGSLLDIDSDIGSNEGLEMKLAKVEAVLEKLYKIENERKETLQDLKKQTVQDDISHLLILNKKANVDQQIFAAELEKFRPHQQRIAATIHQQQQAIQELTAAFKSLMEGEEAQRLQARWEAGDRLKRSVIERFDKARTSYLEVKEGLSKGVQFYSNLSDVIESLSRNVQKFIQERSQEKEKLAAEIENARISEEQRLLREKIDKYTTIAPSAPSAPSHDVSQLADQTRQMSISERTPPVAPAVNNVHSTPLPGQPYIQTYGQQSPIHPSATTYASGGPVSAATPQQTYSYDRLTSPVYPQQSATQPTLPQYQQQQPLQPQPQPQPQPQLQQPQFQQQQMQMQMQMQQQQQQQQQRQQQANQPPVFPPHLPQRAPSLTYSAGNMAQQQGSSYAPYHGVPAAQGQGNYRSDLVMQHPVSQQAPTFGYDQLNQPPSPVSYRNPPLPGYPPPKPPLPSVPTQYQYAQARPAAPAPQQTSIVYGNAPPQQYNSAIAYGYQRPEQQQQQPLPPLPMTPDQHQHPSHTWQQSQTSPPYWRPSQPSNGSLMD